MPLDKYSALWVSHTSIGDFLNCPRAYFLKNVYRDPNTGHKIQLINPPLALGQVIHQILEEISLLPKDQRFDVPLMARFATAWEKVSGKQGGFVDKGNEHQYRNRGQEMMRRVMKNPGPLANLAIKIKMSLPYFWLSQSDNIILCGKLDWLEYMEETNRVHIIDFKTGKKKEEVDSLQLPIYLLLTQNCQEREVEKASYWYLEFQGAPEEVKLPEPKKAKEEVLETAKKIKTARALERFPCKQKSGCKHCRPLEAILEGKAELIGVDEFDRDTYILEKSPNDQSPRSEIL